MRLMATGIALLLSLAQLNAPDETLCEIFRSFDRQTELYRLRTQLLVAEQHALDEPQRKFEEQLQEFEGQLHAALAQRLSSGVRSAAAVRT